MTECDLKPGPVTYSKKYAQRIADRQETPYTVQRCGDHYHVPDGSESLALRIRRSIGGRK